MKRSEREWMLLKNFPRSLAQLAYREGESPDYNPYPMDDPRWAEFRAEMEYLWAKEELNPRYGEP